MRNHRTKLPCICIAMNWYQSISTRLQLRQRRNVSVAKCPTCGCWPRSRRSSHWSFHRAVGGRRRHTNTSGEDSRINACAPGECGGLCDSAWLSVCLCLSICLKCVCCSAFVATRSICNATWGDDARWMRFVSRLWMEEWGWICAYRRGESLRHTHTWFFAVYGWSASNRNDIYHTNRLSNAPILLLF